MIVDDSVGEPGETSFDVPERAAAERVVVVLRRDEPRAAQLRRDTAVDVGVHEVRVHDVGPELARETREEQRVEVARRADAHRRHAQRAVEVGRAPGGIVETDEHRLDAALRERRQQRQQVALRAADAADAVDVQRPSSRAQPLDDVLESGRREDRKQEVPGDAVARRADEDQRAQPSGTRAGAARARRTVRGAKKRPTSASAYSTHMYAGSITRRPMSNCVPAPLRSLVSRTFGCQSTFAESAASFALSPGCLRIHSTARCW